MTLTFKIMTVLGCMIYMSVMARICGGGIVQVPPALKKVPKYLFGLGFGLASYHLHGHIWLAALATIFSGLWMDTGHGTAYEMGYNPAVAQSGRKEFLSAIIDHVTKAAGKPLGGLFYCVAFMCLKGLLIGLPAQPFGLWIAIMWPWGYMLGELKWRDGAKWDWQEIISGIYAGLVVGLILVT